MWNKKQKTYLTAIQNTDHDRVLDVGTMQEVTALLGVPKTKLNPDGTMLCAALVQELCVLHALPDRPADLYIQDECRSLNYGIHQDIHRRIVDKLITPDRRRLAGTTAYRVHIENMGVPRNATAEDLVQFEAKELGNTDIRKQARASEKILGTKLKDIPFEEVLWVGTDKDYIQKMYGTDHETGEVHTEVEEIPLTANAVILAEDFDGGYLIWNKQ